MERWMPIPECKHFLVSDHGRVINTNTNHYRKLSKQGRGYLGFSLFRGTKSYRIHAVVATLFCDKPVTEKKLVVNHIDGDKHNNHFKNLEWVTYSQNVKHALDYGLMHKGEKRFGAKLEHNQVICIKEARNKGFSCAGIARYFNISAGTISSITKGKRWKHVIV
jgi:HNH endonuclease/NUMOD4 motif